jgi:hypothetical protein
MYLCTGLIEERASGVIAPQLLSEGNSKDVCVGTQKRRGVLRFS